MAGDATTMTTTIRKQTAGNNAFLAKVKRAMNAPIFREASRLANAEGEAAARAYVQRFFTSPVDAGLDNIIAAIGRPR
jgi:hypothetical protein